MSQRTTIALVKEVLGSNYDTRNSPSLQPFIDTASVVVDQVVALAASNRSITIGAAQAELIERWLSGHFYAQMDMLYKQKQTGKASGKFQGETGMYLESTLYGQSAMMVDTSGMLRVLDKRKVVRMDWLGLAPSAQTPYSERD